MKKNPNQLFILILFSSLLVVFGLGVQKSTPLLPENLPKEFKGVSQDGWMQEKAGFVFENLFSFGNKGVLDFDFWRPDSVEEIEFSVFICQESFGEIKITKKNHIFSFPLPFACNPKTIGLEAKNPFKAGDKDPRLLSAKLKQVSLRSPLYFPISSLASMGLVFFASLLSLVLWYLAFGERLRFLVVAFPVIALALFWNAPNHAISTFLPLWVLVTLLGLGFSLAQVLTLPEPPSRLSGLNIILFLILILGTGLRLYGIDFGLPYTYHPDEPRKIHVIQNMISREDFNPRYFLHPSLLLYLSMFTHKLSHVLGFENISLYLSGRLVSALAGSLSIWLVFKIGTTLFSSLSGLIAAAFFAVLPLSVTLSRYFKEDALFLFFLLFTTLLVGKLIKEKKTHLYYVAGICAGLSASSKYTGVSTLILILVAPWLVSRQIYPVKHLLKHLPLVILCMGVSFLAASPYTLLDFPRFIHDINFEKMHVLSGHSIIPIDSWSQYWTYHFWRSIVPGMTWSGTIIAILGFSLLVKRKNIESLLVLAPILFFYLTSEWVRSKPFPQPERYILPCIPFLALAAGEFLSSLRKQRFIFFILLFLILIPPLTRTLTLASEIYSDTRNQAATWMHKNIPIGSEIYILGVPYSPQFPQSEFKFIDLFNMHPYQVNLKKLRQGEAQYFVASSFYYDRFFSQPKTDIRAQRNFNEIFKNLPLLAEFKSHYGTYGFHNPTIRIYGIMK